MKSRHVNRSPNSTFRAACVRYARDAHVANPIASVLNAASPGVAVDPLAELRAAFERWSKVNLKHETMLAAAGVVELLMAIKSALDKSADNKEAV